MPSQPILVVPLNERAPRLYQTTLQAYAMGLQRNELLGNDQFTQYTEAVPEPLPVSNDYNIPLVGECTLPQVRQLAFDTLSAPAMSAECERIFSSCKKLITAERNKLRDDIIEATECLKGWWDAGLLEMPEVVEP